MKLDEFLKQVKGEDYTFTIAKAVKDDAPFYHDIFRQTPIRSKSEWIIGNLKDYIVINPDSCPIDISGLWQRWYKSGRLNCAIITTEEDMYKHYSEKQAKEMIEWYDKKVKEWLEK